jgi:hypothetical protein
MKYTSSVPPRNMLSIGEESRCDTDYVAAASLPWKVLLVQSCCFRVDSRNKTR